jgi:hypothetical protein
VGRRLRIPHAGARDTMPSWVGCVTVCADADADGQRYARELARRLLRGGIEVFVDGLVS